MHPFWVVKYWRWRVGGRAFGMFVNPLLYVEYHLRRIGVYADASLVMSQIECCLTLNSADSNVTSQTTFNMADRVRRASVDTYSPEAILYEQMGVHEHSSPLPADEVPGLSYHLRHSHSSPLCPDASLFIIIIIIE